MLCWISVPTPNRFHLNETSCQLPTTASPIGYFRSSIRARVKSIWRCFRLTSRRVSSHSDRGRMTYLSWILTSTMIAESSICRVICRAPSGMSYRRKRVGKYRTTTMERSIGPSSTSSWRSAGESVSMSTCWLCQASYCRFWLLDCSGYRHRDQTARPSVGEWLYSKIEFVSS